MQGAEWKIMFIYLNSLDKIGKIGERVNQAQTLEIFKKSLKIAKALS